MPVVFFYLSNKLSMQYKNCALPFICGEKYDFALSLIVIFFLQKISMIDVNY